MTEFATGEKKIVPPQRSTEDLSKEMEQSMEREPDEQIRIVRVFGNCYRCNWWVEDKASQPHWLATGKIRRSALVRATKTSEGLRIEQMT